MRVIIFEIKDEKYCIKWKEKIRNINKLKWNKIRYIKKKRKNLWMKWILNDKWIKKYKYIKWN